MCNGQLKFFKNEIGIWKRSQENIFRKIIQIIKNNIIVLVLTISLVLYLKYNISTSIIFLTYILLLFL